MSSAPLARAGKGLPSHEGSGLKFVQDVHIDVKARLPSHEGSGLKWLRPPVRPRVGKGLPSHEGSGLKSDIMMNEGVYRVSPRMRGVD